MSLHRFEGHCTFFPFFAFFYQMCTYIAFKSNEKLDTICFTIESEVAWAYTWSHDRKWITPVGRWHLLMKGFWTASCETRQQLYATTGMGSSFSLWTPTQSWLVMIGKYLVFFSKNTPLFLFQTRTLGRYGNGIVIKESQIWVGLTNYLGLFG